MRKVYYFVDDKCNSRTGYFHQWIATDLVWAIVEKDNGKIDLVRPEAITFAPREHTPEEDAGMDRYLTAMQDRVYPKRKPETETDHE